jgi:hypothetical protein
MIQGEDMPTKLRKPPVVEEDEELEDDEEDEEEEVKPVKRTTAKTKAASAPVATKKARANGTAVAAPKASTKKAASAAATPQSARHFVTQVLLAGAPQDEVKKRAIALAKKEGSEASFKTFNVPYFINFLVEQKGYRKIEKNGTVKLVAPRA